MMEEVHVAKSLLQGEEGALDLLLDKGQGAESSLVGMVLVTITTVQVLKLKKAGSPQAQLGISLSSGHLL